MIRFSRKQLRIPYLVFLLVFVVLPLFVILYYALTLLYYSYPQLEQCCPSAEVIKRYHMQNAYEAFKEFQELFGYLVADEAQVVTGGTFLIDGTVDYISNVKKLVK